MFISNLLVFLSERKGNEIVASMVFGFAFCLLSVDVSWFCASPLFSRQNFYEEINGLEEKGRQRQGAIPRSTRPGGETIAPAIPGGGRAGAFGA